MSAGTLVPTLPPVVPPVPVRRFTVDEYHQMIRAGILGEDDNVELLEGWIVPKMPRNPAHDALIAWVHNRVLAPRLREGWSAGVNRQSPRPTVNQSLILP